MYNNITKISNLIYNNDFDEGYAPSETVVMYGDVMDNIKQLIADGYMITETTIANDKIIGKISGIEEPQTVPIRNEIVIGKINLYHNESMENMENMDIDNLRKRRIDQNTDFMKKSKCLNSN